MDDKEIYSYASLDKAAQLCTKNVNWKENVTLWMADKHANLIKLSNQIANGTYRLSTPHVFHVTDPKPRTVSATPFRDRVVQRSMCMNGLYDILTKPLIYDNCACQKGKGVSFAIDRLKTHMRRFFMEEHTNQGYIVRLDIRKYFPSIPHQKLKEVVLPDIESPLMRHLLEMIIDESVKVKCEEDLSFNDQGFGVRGIGLGSQISQLLALRYLSPLDHYIKERLRVKHYVRYMDDMIMVVRTKEEAEHIFAEVDAFIQDYGLKLNPKSKVCRLDQPFEFLKMVFKLTPTGAARHRLVRKAMLKETRRANDLCRKFKENKISYRDLLDHTNSWFGYARSRASSQQVRYIKALYHKNLSSFKKVRLNKVQ